MVNSLDEALRTLKNEIRQKRPLGVALTAQPAVVLQEVLERGLLPDLQIQIGDDENDSYESSIEGNLHSLAQLGMARLKLVQKSGAALPSAHLAAWLVEREWHETLFVTAANVTDTALLAMDALVSGPRRAWLEGISRYQRLPDRTLRFVWLSGEEQRSFAGPKPETA